MQDGTARQIRSAEIQDRINANLELARNLSKTAGEIEEKLLGTSTPCSPAGGEEKNPTASFLSVTQDGLSKLHSELLHLKDILKSINSEF